MKIELYIDGEKKIFTVPYVPALARRKYLEFQAKVEENGAPQTTREIIEADDIQYAILSEVVFQGKFTLDELYAGTDLETANAKLDEAIFGKKKKTEGNAVGKQ